jgi:hypothetical protein
MTFSPQHLLFTPRFPPLLARIIYMSRLSIVYEILIASPGDVVNERTVVAEVIEDWNSAHSRVRKISLQAVRWELDGVPATGDRPQAILNRQLVESADILIAVFGIRLGTPTGKAPSGTVEELEHFRSQGKPVLMYFSGGAVPRDHDPEQLRLLQEYRSELESNTLSYTFPDLAALRRRLSRDLANVMNSLAGAAGDSASRETESLIVHSAVYHPASYEKPGDDVTGLVQSIIKERGPSFRVDINTFGDPFINLFKALTIDYEYRGHRRTKIIPQDHWFNLP